MSVPKKIQKFLFSFLGLMALVFAGCENRAPEISGIVAISKIETVACQPRTKTFKIRNNNDTEPQRVQGVLFELGTNEDKFFKILSVTVGGAKREVVGNLEEEILLPPGGVMEVQVQYNPKETTAEGEYHDTYLDVVLNGPKMGVMQIEIDGTAPTALPGCTNDPTGGRVFKIVSVKTVLSHKDLAAPVETDLDVKTAVDGDLIFNGEENAVKILPEGWPTITFPLPDDAPIPEINIVLNEETPTADFTSGSLKFEGVTLEGAGGAGVYPGLTLTTGSITIDSSQAPNVVGGSITFTGSDLDSDGEMTLVVAAALTNSAVKDQEKVGGGVFGLYITVQEDK
jgi:hypothetical protein